MGCYIQMSVFLMSFWYQTSFFLTSYTRYNGTPKNWYFRNKVTIIINYRFAHRAQMSIVFFTLCPAIGRLDHWRNTNHWRRMIILVLVFWWETTCNAHLQSIFIFFLNRFLFGCAFAISILCAVKREILINLIALEISHEKPIYQSQFTSYY